MRTRGSYDEKRTARKAIQGPPPFRSEISRVMLECIPIAFEQREKLPFIDTRGDNHDLPTVTKVNTFGFARARRTWRPRVPSS
jgi:hypothetical protein